MVIRWEFHLVLEIALAVEEVELALEAMALTVELGVVSVVFVAWVAAIVVMAIAFAVNLMTFVLRSFRQMVAALVFGFVFDLNELRMAEEFGPSHHFD